MRRRTNPFEVSFGRVQGGAADGYSFRPAADTGPGEAKTLSTSLASLLSWSFSVAGTKNATGTKKIARSRMLRATLLRLLFAANRVQLSPKLSPHKEPSVWMVARWQPAGSTVRRYHPD
jgi:hypothetical protein